MCGKDIRKVSLSNRDKGSPPHVRERPMTPVICTSDSRITPACAGKTIRKALLVERYRDHPRMCGKDSCLPCLAASTAGSPPHVRERPHEFEPHPQESGITPACAGKTVICISLPSLWQDHPRMCGKDRMLRLLPGARPGSPPHVRERRPRHIFPYYLIRITPACAGKTCNVCSWC